METLDACGQTSIVDEPRAEDVQGRLATLFAPAGGALDRGPTRRAAAACPLGPTRDEPHPWKRRGPSGHGRARLPSGCR